MNEKDFFEVTAGKNNVFTRDPEASVSSIYRRLLKVFKNMQAGKKDLSMNTPCNGCTACCTHIDKVELGPNDNPADYACIPGPNGAHQLLKNPDTGNCIYLVDGQCEIYDKRPETCRVFDCRVYAICGTTYGRDDTSLDQRILEWDLTKMLKTHEDEIIRVAARMCLFQMKEHNFPAIPLIALVGHKPFLEEAERIFRKVNQNERSP